MRRTRAFAVSFFARWVLGCLALCLPLAAETRYRIDLAEHEAGWLTVQTETVCPEKLCDFQMPVWSATYQIRDFAQHVVWFKAQTPDGEPLPVSKVNPSRWRLKVDPGAGVVVRYRLRADRPGPFGAFASQNYVHLNLSQVLAYPVDSRREPFVLGFTNKPADWKIAVELEAAGDRFTAPSYDRLVDTPLLLADFEETTFEHDGRRIRLAVLGEPGSYKLSLLADAAREITAGAAGLMGGLPFDSYTFAYVFAAVPGGGMEYRNGTVIYGPAECKRCGMAHLAAHEFFHVWNIKRIRPRSLTAVDYTRVNVTPSLWFAEGVTSAYAQFLLLDAGLQSQTEFLRRLGRLITRYERRPASRVQSAEESSTDAWLERYAAYGRADRSVSYYLKGELIGHLLDLAIRHASGNRRSLDDVMRRLNEDYAQRGRPYDDTRTLETVASEVAGRDMSREFDLLVRSARPIPWDRYLGYAGLRLQEGREEEADPGLTLANPPGRGLLAAAVEPGGAAEQAGFRVGDRIVRLGGAPVTAGPREFLALLSRAFADEAPIEVERNGMRLLLSLETPRIVQPVLRVVERDERTSRQEMVRRGWLRQPPERSTRMAAPAGEAGGGS